MSPRDFSGETAEPMIGEVTALRSFRITDDGYLLPLTDAGGHEPWPTETSSAKCNRKKPHLAPDPHCTCGFYAYGNRAWVENDGLYAWSRLVLAAVHCSGRLVAGEKGLRGEKMRLVGCYVSKGIPSAVLDRLKENYPGVEFFTSRKALLSAHPETHLPTYIDAPKGRHLKPSLSWLQFTLAILAVPFLGFSILNPLMSSGEFTVGRAASPIFAILVWSPFLFEALVILRAGVPLEHLESMRRAVRRPWISTPPTAAMNVATVRLATVFAGIALLVFNLDQPIFPLGWPALGLAGFMLAVTLVIWSEVRRAFPLSKKFPLVPRTRAVHGLRESLPDNVTPSRESAHRHRVPGEDCVIEMLDMGGYGVGMVHFDIFSDPEDYPPALGTGPDLAVVLSRLAASLDIPRKRWIAYIASDEATLRVLTAQGEVSPPVPLEEIDTILPFPTRAWCAPGVRAAYVAALRDEALDPDAAPFVLQAGYRDRRANADDFSDPSIGNALSIARRSSEQFAYRTFKKIEAHLPEGVEPAATPSLPQEEGGTAEKPEAEMSKALMTLMNSSTEPSSSKGLMFAMGELIDALSVSTDDLNEVMSIDPDAGHEAPRDAEVGMKGAHLLLLGSVGAALSDFVTALSFPGPEGRVYAVLGKGKNSIINATLTVREVRSERGGDDDVDALKDAGE